MRIFILILVFLNIPNISLGTDTFNVQEFMDEVKSYSSEVFPEFADENWLSNLLTRGYEFRRTRYFKKSFECFFERV